MSFIELIGFVGLIMLIIFISKVLQALTNVTIYVNTVAALCLLWIEMEDAFCMIQLAK